MFKDYPDGIKIHVMIKRIKRPWSMIKIVKRGVSPLKENLLAETTKKANALNI